MKRKAFIALAAVVMVFSACLRDDDLALLKKPIHLQGSMDPSVGVPAAYGRMTIHDMLHMLSSTYTGHIYDTTDIITIYFDTSISDTIRSFVPYNPPDPGSKSKTMYTMIDTTFEYSVNITMFDGVQFAQYLANDNITIGDLWLDLRAILKAIVPQNVVEYVNNEEYVQSNINNFQIFYTKHNGTEVEFTDFSIPDETLKHLVDGDTMTRPHINMRNIVNDMPKRIRVKFHYDFAISDEFIYGHSFTPQQIQDIKDSINKLHMFYDVNAYAEFPFDIKIKRLPYAFTIDLKSDSLPRLDIQQTLDSIARGLSVDLSDAKLTLAFDNAIPAKFNMATYLIDANGSIIGDTLIHDTILAAAPVRSDGAGHYVSNGSTRTVVTVKLDEQRLRDLSATRKIGFNFAMATDNGSNNVSIRRDDYLYLKAFIMVHPQANIDIPLTNQGLIK